MENNKILNDLAIEDCEKEYLSSTRFFRIKIFELLADLYKKSSEKEKQCFKEKITQKIKSIISSKTKDGNLFQTKEVNLSYKQFPENLLNSFRNAILNAGFKLEQNIRECPITFRTIIKDMTKEELNIFYNQCLQRQQQLIKMHSQDENMMFYQYYNRNLIENIEILAPILSFDFPYQSGMDVVGGKSFWGRQKNKNIKKSSSDDDIVTSLGFYKNLLIALDTEVFCDTKFGFMNRSYSHTDLELNNLINELKSKNPNICKQQCEFILCTERVNNLINCRKRLLKTIEIDSDNKFDIYEDGLYSSLFIVQYKTTPNPFADKKNGTSGSKKCEILLFFLPDNTLDSAFQISRLDMYSEINSHKCYGKAAIDTVAHVHEYSMEDAALNNNFDREPKEINLAHYNRFRNLPLNGTYTEYENYFKNINNIFKGLNNEDSFFKGK